MTNNAWVLQSIHITSFLGVGPKGIHLDLSHQITVLSGNNGSGKTTITSAIEWALFGELELVPDYQVGGVGKNVATYKSIMYGTQNETNVTLHFAMNDPTENLIWSRTRRRKTPAPNNDDLACLHNNQAVTANPEEIFGLSHALYTRAIAPKQTTIRNLVHSEEPNRNQALDVLFGLEPLHNLSIGLSKGHRNIAARTKKITVDRNNLFATLKAPLAVQFDQRSAAREKALSAGFDKADLSFQFAMAEIQRISKDFNIAIPADILNQPPSSAGIDALESMRVDLDRHAHETWDSSVLRTRASTITNIKRLVEKGWADSQNLAEKLGRFKETLTLQTSQFGTLDEVQSEYDSTGSSLQQARDSLSTLNRAAGLLDQAKLWISDHAHQSLIDCPVCGTGAERTKLEASITANYTELTSTDGLVEEQRALIGDLEAKEQAQASVLADLNSTTDEVKRFETMLGELFMSLNADLQASIQPLLENLETLSPADKLIGLITEISDIDSSSADKTADFENLLKALIPVSDSAADNADKLVLEADSQFSGLLSKLNSFRFLLEFLREDAAMTTLDNNLQDPRLINALAGIEETKTIETIVKTLAEKAGEISLERAHSITTSIGEPLNNWFQLISKHDVLNGATIEPETRRSGGFVRNTYKFRVTTSNGSGHVTPGPNLSGGYEMVLAVSALCAMQSVSSSQHKLDLFILDEPTDSLDEELSDKMGLALALHAPAARTIVTTNRKDFAETMISAAGPVLCAVTQLDPWSQQTGTSIS